MKKAIASCLIGASLLVSSTSIATEKTYKYKYTLKSIIAAELVLQGLVSASGVTYTAYQHKDMGSAMVGVILSYIAGGSLVVGATVGGSATKEGFKYFEKDSFLKAHKALMINVKYTIALNNAPSNASFSKVLGEFESTAKTDNEKALEFSKMVLRSEIEAAKVLKIEGAEQKDLNVVLEGKFVQDAITNILGENANTKKNRKLFMGIFAAVLVNEYVIANKK